MAAMDTSVPEKEKQQGKVSTDFVFDNIGQFGKWQLEILFIICLSKFPVGWHQLATVFLAPPVSYTCADPGNTTDACSPDCKRVEYDRSVFKNTVIMEWDLICDKSTWADTGQSVFMFGVLTGNVIFGIWADKKGRRPPLLFSVVLQLVAGVAASLAPSYWMFVLCRYFLAVAIGGNMLTTFCVLMEIIGPKHRELINGVIFQIPFNFGHLLLAPVAYFIRDFRTLQFVLSSFSVLLLSFFWICPESPRWLVNAGRVDESIEVLKKAAKKNKLPTDNIDGDVISARAVVEAQPTQSKGNVTDLLKTPNLRKKTLCIFYNWLAIGFNFFGVSTYIGKLSGNIFVNVAVSASFSIPGLMMAAPSCKYLGRTRAIALAHAVCILGMGTFIVMPPHLGTVRLILASLAVFGGMWAFASIYIVAAEVFPTVGRNAGIGVCSMLARIGAMLTPYAAGLSKHAEWVPPAFFCVSSFLAIICILMVPETKGAPLPETLEDAENFGKKKK